MDLVAAIFTGAFLLVVLFPLGWLALAAIFRDKIPVPGAKLVCGGGDPRRGCGYSLEGLDRAGVCPECGKPFVRGALTATRPRWKWERLRPALVCVALGTLLMIVPPYHALVPGYMIGRAMTIPEAFSQARRDLWGWPDGTVVIALLNGWGLAVASARAPRLGGWKAALFVGLCALTSAALAPAFQSAWNQGVVVVFENGNGPGVLGAFIGWMLLGLSVLRRVWRNAYSDRC